MTPERQRIFLALWPPPQVVAHLDGSISAARADSPDWLRWQPTSRWHITVNFLGDHTDDEVRRVERTAAALAARAAPGPVRLAGSGRFGAVFWVGVSTGDWLVQLAAELGRELQPRQERERLRPHVTLARARRRNRVPVGLLQQTADYEGPGWVPDALTLVRSVIGPAPEYEILHSFALGLTPEPAARTR